MAWFDKCAKVPWQPPNAVFKIVWPILYTLYVATIVLEWNNAVSRNVLLIGLAMNLLWVPLFIVNTRAALALLAGMIIVGIMCIGLLNRSDEKAGRDGLWRHSLIFGPYLAWICFAFTLNAYLAYNCI
jgi:tryptophan-rich sensory protein